MQNRKLVGLVSVVVALLGCDDDKVGAASSAQICERVCARSALAHCRNDLPDCESRCLTVRDQSPVACDAQLDAFTYCALRATFTCDVVFESEARECRALQDAWTSCYTGAASNTDAGTPTTPVTQDSSVPTPGLDAGITAQTDAGAVAQSDAATSPRNDAGAAAQSDAGTVTPAVDSSVPSTGPLVCAPAADDAACDTCVKGSCCTALSACGPDCGAIGSCLADPSCVTDDCFDACFAAFPNDAAQFQALTQCAATTCATVCAD